MVIAIILTIVCFFSLAWGEKPIKIGVPLPLSGPYAHDGLIGKQSVIFATEDINSKGGVLGRKLELLYYDVEDVMPEKVMASGLTTGLMSKHTVDSMFLILQEQHRVFQLRHTRKILKNIGTFFSISQQKRSIRARDGLK
jgi:hypothetical protein